MDEPSARISPQTEHRYEAVVERLTRIIEKRLPLHGRGESVSLKASDLVAQHLVRSLAMTKASAAAERSALLFVLRKYAPSFYTSFAAMTKKDRYDRGLEIVKEWTDKAPQKVASLDRNAVKREENKLHEALKRHYKNAAFPCGFKRSACDAILAEAAEKLAASFRVENDLPFDREAVIQLAGITRGARRDLRHNTPKRKHQALKLNRDDILKIADELCGRDYDWKELWSPPLFYPAIARNLWVASLCTGLRPIEWFSARLVAKLEDGTFFEIIHAVNEIPSAYNGLFLLVINAKIKTGDSDLIKSRSLDVSELPEVYLKAIYASATGGSPKRPPPEVWGLIIQNASYHLAKAARKCGHQDGMSFYDARHRIATIGKQLMGNLEISAMLGHSNLRTVGGYGIRARKRGGGHVDKVSRAELAKLGLAIPAEISVSALKQRIENKRREAQTADECEPTAE